MPCVKDGVVFRNVQEELLVLTCSCVYTLKKAVPDSIISPSVKCRCKFLVQSSGRHTNGHENDIVVVDKQQLQKLLIVHQLF